MGFRLQVTALQSAPQQLQTAIGALGDGTFTETVYFKAGAEARQREGTPPPPEMAQTMRDEQN